MVAVGTRLEREQPGRMASNRGRADVEEGRRARRGVTPRRLVPSVDRDPAEGDERRDVVDAHQVHLVPGVGGLQRRGGIGEPAEMEELAAVPPIPEPHPPPLLRALGGHETVRGELQRLLVAVERGEQLGPPLLREELPAGLAGPPSIPRRGLGV